MNPVAERLGELGLPAPLSELASRKWDVVVIGAGHNGLAAAAYLARAGRRVLVLERRERVGGACTLERPFADERYVISPCAYVVGLLDERVISELELRRRGVEIRIADPELFIPFEDGTAFIQWLDPARTDAGLRELGVSENDIAGFHAYGELFDRARRRLRTGERDAWVGPALELAHAGRGLLPLRSRHPPGRQRDRPQRSKRGAGGTRRRGRQLASRLSDSGAAGSPARSSGSAKAATRTPSRRTGRGGA